MAAHLGWKWVLAAATALLLPGGISAQGVPLPTGTLMLGEVMHVLTRDMVSASEIAPGQKQQNLAQSLRARGMTDAQIEGGRVVVLRFQIYWNNRASGNKYSQYSPEPVADGLTVEPGNVVELRLDERGGVIHRVRARGLAEGGCYYSDVPVGAAVEALGALSLVGPRGSASLYCAGIEKEGWQRPRTYWHKLPGAAAESSAAPAALPPMPTPTEVTPEPAVSSEGMATLLFYLNRSSFIYLLGLPIWVDGEKVAELEMGTCDIVLVPSGSHVVAAGTGRSLLEFSRRELSVSVAAGERLVWEYRINDEAVREGSGLLGIFAQEKWEPQAYRFTQRPGTPSDTCALRRPPKVLSAKALAGPEKQP